MTITAHNKRRIHRGATKAPLNSESSSRFSYRDLHPEMYKDKPKAEGERKPTEHAAAVRHWLADNREGTAQAIAKALGYSNSRLTLKVLTRHPDIFEVVGEARVATGNAARVWGVKA